MPKLTQDRVLGLVAVAFGLFIALYWAQHDSETGLVERGRGRNTVGDALAPTVAAGILIVSGLWLTVAGAVSQRFTWANLGFLAVLLACLFASLVLMRWGGPALVQMLTGQEYRPLRDTVPWKYTGFLLGGTTLIAALIFVVERQIRPSRLGIALGVTVILTVLYDLPFEDLLLPPNGDV